MKSLLLEHLSNHLSSWSLGTFGALGEFLFDQGEPLIIAPDNEMTIATARGALRVDNLDSVQPIAYETSRRNRDQWGQAVAFCLPEAKARMNARNLVTELGQDHESILQDHRQEVLFDLGLNTPYVDVCIRTSNSELIDILRTACGQSIWDHEHNAMAAILSHHPHRVFISRIGRLEVYQAIGIERSPEGPHTHVLPKLLASGLHHAANTPIPDGLYAGLMLYPGNPCVDNLGAPRAFDMTLHTAFQQLLEQYGLEVYLQQKNSIQKAFLCNEDIDTYQTPTTKLQRLAARIALRQLHHTHGSSEALKRWRDRFDRAETFEKDAGGHQ